MFSALWVARHISLGTCPSQHAPFFVKLINQFNMYSTVNRTIILSCDVTLHCTVITKRPCAVLGQIVGSHTIEQSRLVLLCTTSWRLYAIYKYTTGNQLEERFTALQHTPHYDGLPLGRLQYQRHRLPHGATTRHATRTTQAMRLPRRRRQHATPSAPHKLVASAGIFYSA